jgi:uncharacterized protein
MGIYFLDTSAIIKRYIFEQGQTWITALCDPVSKNDLFISQAAHVEVVAALCYYYERKEKRNSLTLICYTN